jgi:nitrogen-specific signal transduction histidine kinase
VIRGTTGASGLRLEVDRAGRDVSPAETEGLFRPRAPGTGAGSKIGLFVARGVAEAQGGSATATADDGVLRFRLELPPPSTTNGR